MLPKFYFSKIHLKQGLSFVDTVWRWLVTSKHDVFRPHNNNQGSFGPLWHSRSQFPLAGPAPAELDAPLDIVLSRA